MISVRTERQQPEEMNQLRNQQLTFIRGRTGCSVIGRKVLGGDEYETLTDWSFIPEGISREPHHDTHFTIIYPDMPVARGAHEVQSVCYGK